MKKSLLFISCEEAQHICDKSQYNEASLMEKVKLNIRLLWCKITRSYTSRNGKLTKCMKESEVECLNSNERIEMNDQFQRELTNQDHN